MTISTERIRQYATDEFMFAADDVRAMAVELLAVREAQSVQWPEPSDSSNATGWKINLDFISAVQNDIGYDSESDEAPPSLEHIEATLLSAIKLNPLTATPAPAVPDWKHISNEWADVATSALVWLKNIADGISTPEVAIKNTELGIATCRAAMLQPVSQDYRLNSPVIPDGWKLVPAALTAGNGAKASLIGEFTEVKYINCPECFGDDWCEGCDGSGRIKVEVPVSWTTIKAIWKKGIEHFDSLAAAPTPTKAHAFDGNYWDIPDGINFYNGVPAGNPKLRVYRNDDGHFVISDGGGWLPGVYENEEAADLAHKMTGEFGEILQRLQDAANARGDCVITVADLKIDAINPTK